MKRISDRMRREESGFTLIELMVVVLIIAILIAIAIPTFLGARARAQDRAAQSSLRNTVTSAKTIFTDHENYEEATTSALQEAEPSLSFIAGGTGSGDPNVVSVNGSLGTALLAEKVFTGASLSNSGTCFGIRDTTAGPGTEFFKREDATVAQCNATAVGQTGTPAGWIADW